MSGAIDAPTSAGMLDMDSKAIAKAIRKGNQAALNALREESEEPLSVSGQTFKEVHIVDLDLDGVDLSNTEWESCMLDRVDFGAADLEGGYLTGCTLLGCTFEGTNLDGAALEGCVIKRCVFDGAELNGTEISDTQINDTQLRNLVLSEIDWRALSMTDGSIQSVRGDSGSLTSVTLRQVALEGFDIENMEVSHCTTTVEPVPAGFQKVSGRRKRV